MGGVVWHWQDGRLDGRCGRGAIRHSLYPIPRVLLSPRIVPPTSNGHEVFLHGRLDGPRGDGVQHVCSLIAVDTLDLANVVAVPAADDDPFGISPLGEFLRITVNAPVMRCHH